MKLLQKSLREAHFEATVACFEFPWQIGWKSRIPQFGIIWLVTGNLSPRNLEFYSSFRAILGKFRASWETPLTAWPAKGNPLGPKK